MPIRPQWSDDYWKGIDKETAQKMRSTCPKCGSAQTYYNKQQKVWRCGKCEHSFIIEGFGDRVPWWQRLFRRGS